MRNYELMRTKVSKGQIYTTFTLDSAFEDPSSGSMSTQWICSVSEYYKTQKNNYLLQFL
eukprot:c16011_g2_i1 orf=66-242(+)